VVEQAPKRLIVSLGGDDVAVLTERRQKLMLTYLPEALERYSANLPLLSCSLPISSAPLEARAFFDGVLPEGQYRDALASRAGVVASDTFGLLARYGRDIAGAIVVADPDRDPERPAPSVEPLSRDALETEVEELPTRPLGIHDDSELSLAGLQDKLLLVDLGNGSWGRPRNGQPSTHILKLDSRSHVGVVAAEADGIALARAAGLTDIDVQLDSFGGIDCIIVSRFDRQPAADGTVTRIHQEDSCQAVGRPPTMKYEVRQGGGGPQLTEIARLLDEYSENAADQLDQLARVAAFTALLGNADAHGKNLAFVHRTPGRIELAPLYDQVPTQLWPKLTSDAAMTIAGALSLDTVTPAAVGREAKLWRHSPTRATAAASETAEAVLAATADGTVDPDGTVARFVRSRCERFLTSER